MSQFIGWLVTSSADPTKYSLAVKGFMGSLSVFAVFGGMSEAHWFLVSESVTDVVFFGLSALSAGFTVFGLMRKVQLKRWSAYFGL